jgi:hypothetical protein
VIATLGWGSAWSLAFFGARLLAIYGPDHALPEGQADHYGPTGRRLLTGAATGDAAIWAIPSGARIQHLRDVRDPVEVVAYSPDGRLVAAGTRDGAVQVWRAASGELQSQLVPRRSNITAIEFDRTSGLVLAAGADGTVVVADAALGTPSAVLDAQQGVLVAHFDPSSRTRLGQRAVPGRRRHGPHRLPDLARVGRRRVRRPTGDHAFSRARRGGASRFIGVASPVRASDTLAAQPRVCHGVRQCPRGGLSRRGLSRVS